MSDKLAPPGAWFVCLACGKVSRTKYGISTKNFVAQKSRGWDESCMLNSRPFWEKDCVWSSAGPAGHVLSVNEDAQEVPEEKLLSVPDEEESHE